MQRSVRVLANREERILNEKCSAFFWPAEINPNTIGPDRSSCFKSVQIVLVQVVPEIAVSVRLGSTYRQRKTAKRKRRMSCARTRKEAACRMFADSILPLCFDDFSLVQPLGGSQPIACLSLRFYLWQRWHRDLWQRWHRDLGRTGEAMHGLDYSTFCVSAFLEIVSPGVETCAAAFWEICSPSVDTRLVTVDLFKGAIMEMLLTQSHDSYRSEDFVTFLEWVGSCMLTRGIDLWNWSS